VEWCKLFGSDDSETQPVHWKSIAQDHERFREDLLKAIAVSRAEWDAYWIELKTYRDRAVAHFDPRQISIARYPDFDLALKSSYFYYTYLRAELSKLGEGLLPEDLEQYSLQFAKKCGEVAAVLDGSVRSQDFCRQTGTLHGNRPTAGTLCRRA